MLPFLKRKQETSSGLLIKHRPADEKPDDKDDPSAAHEACAQEIISAVEAKDAKRLAEAMKDMFQILESEPHDEAPHLYDAQNQKAGGQE